MIIYKAFIKSELEVPRQLARRMHDHYFDPSYEEFKPRRVWNLSNAVTSAFKELDPIPQFRATAKLTGFIEGRFGCGLISFIALAGVLMMTVCVWSFAGRLSVISATAHWSAATVYFVMTRYALSAFPNDVTWLHWRSVEPDWYFQEQRRL